MAVETNQETVGQIIAWNLSECGRRFSAFDPLKQATARKFKAVFFPMDRPDCQFEALITLQADLPPTLEIRGHQIKSTDQELKGVQTDNLVHFEQRLETRGYRLTPIPYSQ